MCLETMTHGPNPTEEGEGYKLFELSAGKLVSPFTLIQYGHGQFQQHYETNTWMSDSRDYPLSPYLSPERYQTGFHLFQNKEDAEYLLNRWSEDGTRFVTRKVKYRNVTAKGIQFGLVKSFPTIVAREIFILEEND
jgi:hypothetical protein